MYYFLSVFVYFILIKIYIVIKNILAVISRRLCPCSYFFQINAEMMKIKALYKILKLFLSCSLFHRMRNHLVILQAGPATFQRYENPFPSPLLLRRCVWLSFLGGLHLLSKNTFHSVLTLFHQDF